MVTIDKQDLDRQLNRWQQAIAFKAGQINQAMPRVLKKECQRLVNELIRYTWPVDPEATKADIWKNVTGSFNSLGEQSEIKFENYEAGGKAGRGDVRWISSTSTALYGVQQDKDMRKAKADALYEVYWASRRVRAIKQGGSYILKGNRGRQKVKIAAHIAAKASQVKKLAARIKKHVGRLKASWLPSWIALGRPNSGGAPPRLVTQHEDGARGDFRNELGNKGNPSFTLISYAKGCGSETMRERLSAALRFRAEKMIARIPYILKHPEKISEEVAD